MIRILFINILILKKVKAIKYVKIFFKKIKWSLIILLLTIFNLVNSFAQNNPVQTITQLTYLRQK